MVEEAEHWRLQFHSAKVRLQQELRSNRLRVAGAPDVSQQWQRPSWRSDTAYRLGLRLPEEFDSPRCKEVGCPTAPPARRLATTAESRRSTQPRASAFASRVSARVKITTVARLAAPVLRSPRPSRTVSRCHRSSKSPDARPTLADRAAVAPRFTSSFDVFDASTQRWLGAVRREAAKEPQLIRNDAPTGVESFKKFARVTGNSSSAFSRDDFSVQFALCKTQLPDKRPLVQKC